MLGECVINLKLKSFPFKNTAAGAPPGLPLPPPHPLPCPPSSAGCQPRQCGSSRSVVLSKAAADPPRAGTHGPSAGLPVVTYNARPPPFLVNHRGNKYLPNACLPSFLPQLNSTKMCWPVPKCHTAGRDKFNPLYQGYAPGRP